MVVDQAVIENALNKFCIFNKAKLESIKESTIDDDELEQCFQYSQFLTEYHGLYKIIEKTLKNSNLGHYKTNARSDQDFYIERLQTLVFLALPKYFEEITVLFFQKSFSSFVYAQQQQMDDDDESEEESEQEQLQLALINHACRVTRETGLVRFIESVLIEILYHELEQRISKNAKEIYDHYFLEPYFEWLDQFFYVTVDESSISAYIDKLRYHVMATLYHLRSDELAEIITEYPESNCALSDLKVCIDHLDKQELLSLKFKKLAQEKLFNRENLVENYVRTIRCFNELGISDEMLESIILPSFQEALRSKKSAKQVISIILSESDQKILHYLVKIYDSNEGIATEYQKMLASDILNLSDYSIDEQIRQVELLKTKLGENSLSLCEVMLKDVVDSRRAMTLLKELTGRSLEMHPLVLSRLFWPKIAPKELVLDERLVQFIRKIDSNFDKIRPSRHLEWLHYYGTVTLELEFDNGTFEFKVCPLFASVILFFQDQASHSAGTSAVVVAKSKIQEKFKQNVDAALDFWVNQGAITARDTDFLVNKSLKPIDPKQSGLVSVFEEDSGSGKLEEMRIYWPYIASMLNNMGNKLSLDRIHSLLTMFVQGPNKFKRTKDELKQFMDLMLLEEKVEMQGPLFKMILKKD